MLVSPVIKSVYLQPTLTLSPIKTTSDDLPCNEKLCRLSTYRCRCGLTTFRIVLGFSKGSCIGRDHPHKPLMQTQSFCSISRPLSQESASRVTSSRLSRGKELSCHLTNNVTHSV